MKHRAVPFLLLLAASSIVGAQEPASKDAARVKAAVEKTRSQKSYSVTFEAVVKVPDSDPMKIKGETVWISAGVLFTHYTASGGEEVRLVRAGEKVWVYHIIGEWLTADEAGKPGAGRGVQNPDEVLAAVVKAADQAVQSGKEAAGDILEMKMDGAVLQKVMRQQASSGSFDWVNSAGTVKLVAGGADSLMYKMQVEALVASTDPQLKGKKVGYTADVTLKAYNRDFGLEFKEFDPKAKKDVVIPWPAPFLDEAEKLKGIPDELKAEIQRRRKP